MSIKSIFTSEPTVDLALSDIKGQLTGFDVRMLLFFASCDAYAPDSISAGMSSAFPDAAVFGCSSHAELYNGKTLHGSLTAMAFDNGTIGDVRIEVLENLGGGINVAPVFKAFDEHFKTSMSSVDYHEYGGIILVDGLSMKEEDVMDKIGSHTNITFTGGSSSDALKFEKTYLYYSGKVYSDAAILAVFKTVRGLDFIKTQSVEITDTVFEITKSDTGRRAVLELDGKPAVKRYSEVLGVPPSEVGPLLFANPVGLVIDDDVFIRSCQRVDGDALIFYCNMLEGTTINLLKIKDIIPDTRAAVEDKLKDLGSVEGIIDFRCVLRTIQLGEEDNTEDYAVIFEGIPSIGFSTYGEQYLGHINQTSMMLVFR